MISKFRVWLPDPEVERMLRVKALVFENDKTRCVCGYAYDFYLEDEDAIIMQSMGLLDKNGKEIFEGDIVTDGDVISNIKYHQTLGFYMINKYGFGIPFGQGVDVEYFEDFAVHVSKTFDVIGNIYENPKLLEVTK